MSHQPYFDFTAKALTYLGDPDVCLTTGFTYGFISRFNGKFFRQPLTQIFNGCMMGFACAMGTDFVAHFLIPKTLRPIIPILVVYASFNHIIESILDID